MVVHLKNKKKRRGKKIASKKVMRNNIKRKHNVNHTYYNKNGCNEREMSNDLDTVIYMYFFFYFFFGKTEKKKNDQTCPINNDFFYKQLNPMREREREREQIKLISGNWVRSLFIYLFIYLRSLGSQKPGKAHRVTV